MSQTKNVLITRLKIVHSKEGTTMTHTCAQGQGLGSEPRQGQRRRRRQHRRRRQETSSVILRLRSGSEMSGVCH